MYKAVLCVKINSLQIKYSYHFRKHRVLYGKFKSFKSHFNHLVCSYAKESVVIAVPVAYFGSPYSQIC